MILKLDMKHQGMELYKGYNHNPWMTLTYFTACHLKGKSCSKLENGLSFYDLKKILTPGVILTLPWRYIHAYYHSCLLVYISDRFQVSVYRTIGPLVDISKIIISQKYHWFVH